MAHIGHCLKSYLFLSKKDMGMLAALFVIAFASSFAFLWANSIYIDRLHFTMQILAVILFILLGMNVSFFVYTLISQPTTLLPKLQHMQSNGILQKTISELVVLNMLAIANFGCLTLSYIYLQNLQIVVVSISVASWPLFFLILMNMDVSLYSSKRCYTCKPSEFGGMAVAENCGPAVVPNDHCEIKLDLARIK